MHCNKIKSWGQIMYIQFDAMGLIYAQLTHFLTRNVVHANQGICTLCWRPFYHQDFLCGIGIDFDLVYAWVVVMPTVPDILMLSIYRLLAKEPLSNSNLKRTLSSSKVEGMLYTPSAHSEVCVGTNALLQTPQ